MRTGSCTNGIPFFYLLPLLTNELREAEGDQTTTGVTRVYNWAATNGGLSDEDLLISASVDEIMSREALHQLRWCELSNDVVFGGLWMPMGNLNKVEWVGLSN